MAKLIQEAKNKVDYRYLFDELVILKNEIPHDLPLSVDKFVKNKQKNITLNDEQLLALSDLYDRGYYTINFISTHTSMFHPSFERKSPSREFLVENEGSLFYIDTEDTNIAFRMMFIPKKYESIIKGI